MQGTFQQLQKRHSGAVLTHKKLQKREVRHAVLKADSDISKAQSLLSTMISTMSTHYHNETVAEEYQRTEVKMAEKNNQ